jgi:hypothetical protein
MLRSFHACHGIFVGKQNSAGPEQDLGVAGIITLARDLD